MSWKIYNTARRRLKYYWIISNKSNGYFLFFFFIPAKILLFYIIFYLVLSVYWGSLWVIFDKISIKQDKPKFMLTDSLIGSNPGKFALELHKSIKITDRWEALFKFFHTQVWATDQCRPTITSTVLWSGTRKVITVLLIGPISYRSF